MHCHSMERQEHIVKFLVCTFGFAAFKQFGSVIEGDVDKWNNNAVTACETHFLWDRDV